MEEHFVEVIQLMDMLFQLDILNYWKERNQKLINICEQIIFGNTNASRNSA